MESDWNNEAVTILSKRVKEVNIQTRFGADEDTWPPDQPKTFIPLVLIQHQDNCTITQSSGIIGQCHIDKIASVTTTDTLPNPKLVSHQPLQEVFDTISNTTEVAEVLAPLEISDDPQFIMIEGAPGIGKSFLTQEHEILQKIQVSCVYMLV